MGGAVFGNLAGILAIVAGAIAAVFRHRLDWGNSQFSVGVAAMVFILAAAALSLFVFGCMRMLRDTRAQAGPNAEISASARQETLISAKAGAALGEDGWPTRIWQSFAPRERFVLSLPAVALGLAFVGLVLELLGLLDVLPPRVIPLALALVIAFGAFMVVRRLQRDLTRARVSAMFDAGKADKTLPRGQ